MCKQFSVELEALYPLIAEKLSVGGTVTFSPKGVSMLPLIRQGTDSVRIAPPPKRLFKYDVPLYRRTNGQFVLHRVVDIDGDTYVMCGDNQCTREYGINHNQIIGVMTEIIKPEGTVSVSDKAYMLYSKKQVFKQRIRYVGKKILTKLRLYKQ